MTQFNQKHPDNLAKVLGKNVAEGGVTLPRFLGKMLQKVG